MILTMKYALIIAAVLIILRIDMFVGVAERVWDKVPSISTKKNESEVLEATSSVIESPPNVTIAPDAVSQLGVLLNEFSFNTDRSTRELIISFIKSHAALLQLNPSVLFTQMEKWMPMVKSDNAEIPLLLNDLFEIFKGEQAKVIQQFYTLYFVENPEFFIHYYPQKRDPNCIVLKYAWNTLNKLDAEQIAFRQKQLEELAGKIPGEKLEFAKNCQLVLRVEESKITQDLDLP